MPLLPVSDRLLDPPKPGRPHARPSLPRPFPALYATPEPAPIPDIPSPSSFPTSPYVIDHKRRGPRLLKSFSQADVVLENTVVEPLRLPTSRSFSEGDVVGIVDVGALVKEELRGGEEEVGAVGGDGDGEVEVEVEDFFDPGELGSVAGNAEGSGRWNGSASAAAVEYYDAFEEISSEGISQSPICDLEAELRELRMNVLMEIEKRKLAEETLSDLRNRWQRLSDQLSLVGITLPALSTIMDERNKDLCDDPAEYLQQQIILARVVAGSIGRGVARAEVEMEMESQIEAKVFEIARLTDRLHYYEEANRAMSQRNQEAVELARRHRQKWKQRKRWIWGSMGFVMVVGVAAAGWYHFNGSTIPVPSESSGSSGSDHNQHS